ncbi:MAG TPA: tRNA pseudouridine(38-40) synthase TruA [Saprospiraceae bacterium]|nr:tRNA pseudouridine(38-40) synthase TruA [Saprospiraceae bacterium]
MIFVAMRYKIILSYMGTNYSGWQKQPGEKTVQQTLEEAFSTILREPIEIVGCGRTDTGVHARGYTAHFDANNIADFFKTAYQVNAILPADIAVWSILPVQNDFHARYDAVERSYAYSIHFLKDPFVYNKSFYLNAYQELNQVAMKEAAALIMNFEYFLPFCKTGGDNKNYQCFIKNSEWYFQEYACSYTISANRFLRGMVRLIVGACLNVGFGRLSVDTLHSCLIMQKPLPQQWSVPPQGLCFSYVVYPPAKQAGSWVAYPPGIGSITE